TFSRERSWTASSAADCTAADVAGALAGPADGSGVACPGALGAGFGTMGRGAATPRAVPAGSSKETCTACENQSLARGSMREEKFLRTQSSLKRLGAAMRSTAKPSSNSRGTRGRIQALICCGGSSCSSCRTQACQNSFIEVISLNLDSTLYPYKLSTGGSAAARARVISI